MYQNATALKRCSLGKGLNYCYDLITVTMYNAIVYVFSFAISYVAMYKHRQSFLLAYQHASD